MQPISAVIITKNEQAIIAKTILAVKHICAEVLVADTGSTDETAAIASKLGARVITLPWQGFGATKNAALAAATYNWVLALDADETPDVLLQQSIAQLSLTHTQEIYLLRYKNFIGNKEVKYGEWKPPVKARLFNKTFTQWQPVPIHEGVLRPPGHIEKILDGFLLHTSVANMQEYLSKQLAYAELMAQQYANKGKNSSAFKRYIYPTLAFWQTYLLKGGFLDGRVGFMAAQVQRFYVFYKYWRLYELNASKNTTTAP